LTRRPIRFDPRRARRAEDAKLFPQAGFRLTGVVETVMPVSIIKAAGFNGGDSHGGGGGGGGGGHH
jgi:hypothetical protein